MVAYIVGMSTMFYDFKMDKVDWEAFRILLDTAINHELLPVLPNAVFKDYGKWVVDLTNLPTKVYQMNKPSRFRRSTRI